VSTRWRERAAAWVLVGGAILAAAGVHVARIYEPYTFLIGDCPYYAQTALSILLDGDLDLRNQLRGGLEPHQKQVSLGARGEWYPKHPILMPLVTIPLIPLLGMKAFIVFNLLVLAALALALYELSTLAARPLAAAGASLGMIFGSFLILYDYNYSPDLFACLILTAAVHATLKERAPAAGFLAGLATFAKTSNLFLIPITLAYTAWKGKARGALLFVAAASLPLLAQAGLNLHMFGSPTSGISTCRSGKASGASSWIRRKAFSSRRPCSCWPPRGSFPGSSGAGIRRCSASSWPSSSSSCSAATGGGRRATKGTGS